MSTIHIACRCGQRFTTKPEFAGRTFTCPKCGGPVSVPTAPVPVLEQQIDQWPPKLPMPLPKARGASSDASPTSLNRAVAAIQPTASKAPQFRRERFESLGDAGSDALAGAAYGLLFLLLSTFLPATFLLYLGANRVVDFYEWGDAPTEGARLVVALAIWTSLLVALVGRACLLDHAQSVDARFRPLVAGFYLSFVSVIIWFAISSFIVLEMDRYALPLLLVSVPATFLVFGATVAYAQTRWAKVGFVFLFCTGVIGFCTGTLALLGAAKALFTDQGGAAAMATLATILPLGVICLWVSVRVDSLISYELLPKCKRWIGARLALRLFMRRGSQEQYWQHGLMIFGVSTVAYFAAHSVNVLHPGDHWSNPIDVAATLVFWVGVYYSIWGCTYVAIGKGYPSLLGLTLGCFSILGFLILLCLRPRESGAEGPNEVRPVKRRTNLGKQELQQPPDLPRRLHDARTAKNVGKRSLPEVCTDHANAVSKRSPAHHAALLNKTNLNALLFGLALLSGCLLAGIVPLVFLTRAPATTSPTSIDWPEGTGYLDGQRNCPKEPHDVEPASTDIEIVEAHGEDWLMKGHLDIRNNRMLVKHPGAEITNKFGTITTTDYNGDQCTLCAGLTVRMNMHGQFVPIRYAHPESSGGGSSRSDPTRTLFDTSRLTFSENPSHTLDFAQPEAVTFTNDGKRLLAAGTNASKEPVMMVWDTATWKNEQVVLLQNEVSQLTVTPYEKSLVVASGLGDEVWLLDPLTFQVQHTLTCPSNVISSSVAPDGKTLATISSDDWQVQIWDLATHKVSRTLSGPGELSTCIVHSPDGKYLASTGKRTRLWKLVTGELEKELIQDRDGFTCLFASFSPDGTKLAGACNDGCTRIWDTTSWRTIECFEAEQENVFSVFFSPDGLTLLTRSMEGMDRSDRASVFAALSAGSDVSIWNLPSRSKLNLCNGICVMEPYSIAFSPTGQTVVAKINEGLGVWIGN